MIKYRFLYFKTLTDFKSKLSEIDRQSIVFIQDKKLIWTHGQYYGEVPEAITIDSELSNLSINPVQNNVVKRAIDTLQALCEQTSEDVSHIKNAIDRDTDQTLQKFQEITDFLDSIQDTDDGASIIAGFSELVKQEKNRAKDAEEYLANKIQNAEEEIVSLKNRVTVLEKKPSDTTIHTEDGIFHIFTTLEEYQALANYQDNAIYFILEPEIKTNWTFGGTFPIVFTDGLGTFPITLT